MPLHISRAACIAVAAGVLASAQVIAFDEVTDDELARPSPSDWLHWRRTSDGWGYSPLAQINRDNVHQLQMVWGWAMDAGMQEATPLVYDGIMYLAGPGDKVVALDAANGDFLWEYRREPREGSRLLQGYAVRNIAIHGDKVFLNASDAHVVAIDARSGKVVWETQTADSNKGFFYSAGPLIVEGKVISGLQGCQNFHREKCAITALDSETGKELWRTYSIAQPGDPGEKSWGDVPLLYRAGGDMWLSGSYDKALGLIYWPVSQAKPQARAARGTDGAALYTDATLALDPRDGRIVWHYQYLPGETHDMDDSFENILVEVGGRKSIFEMGKLGILWQIDARSGEFIRATDLGYQNLIDVDRKTGRVTYRPDVVPRLDRVFGFCPSVGGLKSWRAMSYHPDTQAFYIPVQLTCQEGSWFDVKKVEGGGGLGNGKRVNLHHPASEGNLGEFVAMSTSGEILWKHRQRATFNTASLTTAGGLVFVGDWDRYINAYDATSGKLLWQTRATTSPQGFPITYAVKDRQYLAVPIGTGSFSWGSTIPEALTPEIRRPNGGNAILVYALPESEEMLRARLEAGAARSSTGAATGTADRAGAVADATHPDGTYSEGQATRGRESYARNCASCHLQDLSGGATPALKGAPFASQWQGHTIDDLLNRISLTMPAGNAGSLGKQEYLDIIAFMLQANGVTPGDRELKPGADLQRIRIGE